MRRSPSRAGPRSKAGVPRTSRPRPPYSTVRFRARWVEREGTAELKSASDQRYRIPNPSPSSAGFDQGLGSSQKTAAEAPPIAEERGDGSTRKDVATAVPCARAVLGNSKRPPSNAMVTRSMRQSCARGAGRYSEISIRLLPTYIRTGDGRHSVDPTFALSYRTIRAV